MNAVLASLLVLLAVANAGLVDVATAGVAQAGTLGLTTSYTQADYYQVWIPSNANNISLYFDVLGTSPCDLYLAYSFNVIPCGPSWATDGDNYCDTVSSQNIEAYASSHPKTTSISVRDTEFEVGKYLYLSVSRYYPTTTDTVCPYTFTADYTTCAAGQGSAYSYASSTYICAPITNVTFTAQAATATVVNAGSFKSFAMMLPLNVGTLSVTVNSTSVSNELYASTGAVASYYHEQYTGSNIVTGYYELEAITPEAGWFYFTIEDDTATAYNATVEFKYTLCPTGFGGYNCTYPTMMFNATKYNGVAMQLSPNMTSYNDYGPFVYYYVDFPANSTENLFLNVTTQGSGYIYTRFNAYPEYSSNFYDLEESAGGLSTFAFSWQNLYVGGRFYIGIQNTMSVSWLNYTFAGVASAGTTTTSSSTTGSTVAVATVGTSTGSATTSGNGTSTTTGMVTGSVTSGNETDTTGSSTTMAPDTTTSAAGIVGASVVVLALVLAVL